MTIGGFSLMFIIVLWQNLRAIYLDTRLDMKHFSKELPKVLKTLWILFFALGFLSMSHSYGQDGEKLFKQNCSACHMVEKDMVGPALKGVTERWEGKKDLLYEWIKNPAKVKDMGDPYVDDLLDEWMPKGGLMAAQMVNDEEIDAILEYVKNYTPEEKEVAATGTGGEASTATPGEEAKGDGGLSSTWLIIIIFILLILVFSLGGVRSSLTKIDRSILDAEGEELEPELTFWQRTRAWMWKNKAFVSVLGILITCYLVVVAYEGLMGIGVYQGYTPEQPIKFNHTLHAGENEIACVYCHTGALESRTAGVPSANICMNCHKGISEGRSPEGTADIQKIYDAIGWDPESRSYTGETKPIKWVKVHNLPDLAYFNHAQHYVVGEIECQECHGEIQEDYVVAGQHAELTMGWCVDCHNQTEVKMDGNGYYDEIHDRLVESGKQELKEYLEDGSITARELGGWECAKCHY